MFRKACMRIRSSDRNLKYFMIGVLFLGVNNGILQTVFNNYIDAFFLPTPEMRGLLEVPRELPGFLLVVITGMIASFSMRFWAVSVGILSAVGVLGLGFFSQSFGIMIIWMVIWSMADHLFMPVENTMGLQLAKDGRQGKRLGQLSGIRNLAMIFGALLVWIISQSSAVSSAVYGRYFIVAAIAAAAASVFFFKIHPHHDRQPGGKRFIVKRRYFLYYILNIIFGARKQIFLTFAPLLLIKNYGASPATMAKLILIASALGFVFRQYFGLVTDKFGEKKMLIADALILFIICGGFAFIKNVYFLYAFYILDNLMFSAKIARTTYLNKIAENKADIPPTISFGISLDHAVSMTIPVAGGLIWSALGYSKLFMFAGILAFISLAASSMIRVPVKKTVS